MPIITLTVEIKIAAHDSTDACQQLTAVLVGTSLSDFDIIDDDSATRDAWGEACITYLRQQFPYLESDTATYVAEAEHQDGYGYWKSFRTFSDVEIDFHLYMLNK